MTFTKASSVALPIIVLLFSYQNCQKAPYSEAVGPVSPSANQNVQNDIAEEKIIVDLDGTSIQNLIFTDRMPVQMNHSGKAYTLLDMVQFSIDWQSGQVQQTSSQNHLLGKYCLNKESLAVLKGLLSAGQVCEYHKAPSSQVCAQIMVPGYIRVLTTGGLVEIGSQSDSCGTQRTDFCDDRGTSLKEWFISH